MGWDKVTKEADLGHIDPWTVGRILQHECKIDVVEVHIDAEVYVGDVVKIWKERDSLVCVGCRPTRLHPVGDRTIPETPRPIDAAPPSHCLRCTETLVDCCHSRILHSPPLQHPVVHREAFRSLARNRTMAIQTRPRLRPRPPSFYRNDSNSLRISDRDGYATLPQRQIETVFLALARYGGPVISWPGMDPYVFTLSVPHYLPPWILRYGVDRQRILPAASFPIHGTTLFLPGRDCFPFRKLLPGVI